MTHPQAAAILTPASTITIIATSPVASCACCGVIRPIPDLGECAFCGAPLCVLNGCPADCTCEQSKLAD